MTTAEAHKQHFFQTMAALENIARNFSPPPSLETLTQRVGRVFLPEPDRPLEQTKVAIFDMDETLIHCVDDLDRESPDVILEIDFSPEGQHNPEDIVCAGINIRPYALECLEEASKHFQVVVFTASQQTYADAILDYLDPHRRLISHRMYRHHCFQSPEGYYVKDLRVIANRPLSHMVLVDNSVYSFAYQLDNGVPIVSFYREPPKDEEMLHLTYYLQTLAAADDVRPQNRAAFELHQLAGIEERPTTDEAFAMIPEVVEDDDS
jgi:CTD small phosphatase-like protein 2